MPMCTSIPAEIRRHSGRSRLSPMPRLTCRQDLRPYWTWIRGGFNTVDLRDAINSGLVMGPRMQVVGQSINQRASNYYPDNESIRFLDGFTENKNVNSP